jgi:hypothetical protein
VPERCGVAAAPFLKRKLSLESSTTWQPRQERTTGTSLNFASLYPWCRINDLEGKELWEILKMRAFHLPSGVIFIAFTHNLEVYVQAEIAGWCASRRTSARAITPHLLPLLECPESMMVLSCQLFVG